MTKIIPIAQAREQRETKRFFADLAANPALQPPGDFAFAVGARIRVEAPEHPEVHGCWGTVLAQHPQLGVHAYTIRLDDGREFPRAEQTSLRAAALTVMP